MTSLKMITVLTPEEEKEYNYGKSIFVKSLKLHYYRFQEDSGKHYRIIEERGEQSFCD